MVLSSLGFITATSTSTGDSECVSKYSERGRQKAIDRYRRSRQTDRQKALERESA